MTARIHADRVELSEVHRFANRPVRAAGTLHWDILSLYQGILDGLRKAGPVGSIGIDSWAVDYGLLDSSGRLIGNPVHYRDDRSSGVMERVVAEVGASAMYEVSGLQFLPFNTVYQLMADRGSLERAETLLMIPDLLTYWLTASIGAEVTNASTTGLYDVRTGDWARPLMSRLGIPDTIFPPLRRPGSPAGTLRPGVATETGLTSVPVIAVASHDTASAVAAVPAAGPRFAYISSGTWSLVGVELPAPVLTDESRTANFTNEAGLDGTTRYLRNVMGLWILQECLRAWGDPELSGLLAAAERARPFGALIDPDHPSFLPPGDMPGRIAAYCERTGQRAPSGPAEVVRCVLESLALAYRRALGDAVRLSGHDVKVIHIVGGGARNALLCQMTADATGLPVQAGPVEAAALGNALVQARAQGLVSDIRELVRRSEPITAYEPSGDQTAWSAAAGRLSGH
ncbi:rhamnulokinase family protein [Sphaerisporangium flaviroseum]|uniref:Rhamnulokinase family protein n=1 Tax=Sphaerisporangium flaviroseum TaxID=509199 RepID=A0ABP7HTY4_9ACTN